MIVARVAGVLLCFFIGSLASPGGWAVIETYEFSAPDLEARYHRLSQELRCPKCQNQNIADSNAPIAEDLRGLLYQQLERGASDAEILDDMVARYGEFVRYRPSADGLALWLWLAPVLMLMGGAVLVVVLVRRSSRAGSTAITSRERERMSALLADDAERHS